MEGLFNILLNALPEALGALFAAGIIALLSYLFVKRFRKESYSVNLQSQIIERTKNEEELWASHCLSLGPLPYLSNRSKQLEELEALLCECESTLHKKPLVGIIHGDEHECHEEFIRKLEDKSFWRRLLHLPTGKDSIQTFKIHWPIQSVSIQQRLEGYKSKLSQVLTGELNSTIEEIVHALNSRLRPVLIYSTIQAGSWKKHEPELIDQWIDFWDCLPDLAVGKKLLVFLCVHYKNIEGMKRSEAKKYDKLNKGVRKYIENLDLKRYANISGLVLTELCRIKYEELDEWMTEWAANHCDTELLRYEIDQLYKRQGMNAICMVLLAQELRKLCLKTLKPGV